MDELRDDPYRPPALPAVDSKSALGELRDKIRWDDRRATAWFVFACLFFCAAAFFQPSSTVSGSSLRENWQIYWQSLTVLALAAICFSVACRHGIRSASLGRRLRALKRIPHQENRQP